ncbi:hypothetical protein [Tahibacter amnicola]|uniref:General secretion pathway protein N n=1 Tax=Tahibacter amnicola TaxID=2976241 RepID=A0ABY6BET9_9GAMM|nr:hypothetical protein [Tahibacter amnicola]UXI67783.1 hypothetical protein N4264_24120 [Tahibacter amnicola]
MNARTAQMMTMVLAGSCGVLSLAGVLAWMGAGRGYSWAPEGEVAPLTGVGRINAETFTLPPELQFDQVKQRPIFNEDRKPTPLVEDEVKPPVEINPLNITLTGVILTPDVQLAMVRDNAKNEALSLKIGMPLPGEQQGWTLAEIRPRAAVFKSADNKTSEVELEVAPGLTVPPSAKAPSPASASAPPPPGAPPAGTAATNTTTVPSQPPDRAAELQRRIEERRREMREQAEKLREQQEMDKNTE